MRLNICNLKFGFEDNLLFEDVDLQLEAGDSLCLHTAVLDGASSLLKCIAGVFPAQSGEVLVDGIDIHSLPPKKRVASVCYCYEHKGLISTFTVLNNVLFPIRYHGFCGEKEAKRRVLELAERLDIAHILDYEPYQLNDVQTRLVNVMRALCFTPKVILLDEVQAGMSEDLIDNLLDVLKDYQQQFRFAMIMATTAGDETYFADKIAHVENKTIKVAT